MKIEIQRANNGGIHAIEIIIYSNQVMFDAIEEMTLDEIEDLESNLLDIQMQLRAYRMKQNHD